MKTNENISKSVLVGIGMGIVFWIALDNFLLGVMFGIIFAIAIREEARRIKKVKKGKKKKGKKR